MRLEHSSIIWLLDVMFLWHRLYYHGPCAYSAVQDGVELYLRLVIAKSEREDAKGEEDVVFALLCASRIAYML